MFLDKHRRQNLILIRLQGCSCVLRLSSALPMKKDAHCIELFSAFAFYREELGTGKCGQMAQKFSGESEEKGIPRYTIFSQNIPPGCTLPFEFFPELPKFHSDDKRSYNFMSTPFVSQSRAL